MEVCDLSGSHECLPATPGTLSTGLPVCRRKRPLSPESRDALFCPPASLFHYFFKYQMQLCFLGVTSDCLRDCDKPIGPIPTAVGHTPQPCST